MNLRGGTFYRHTGLRNKRVCSAWIAQTRAKKVWEPVLGEPPHVFYGVKQHTLGIWKKVLKAGAPYVYIDQGYFTDRTIDGGFFRVCVNEVQVMSWGDEIGYGLARLNRYGLWPSMRPWRKSGSHILVCTQTPFWYERHGTTLPDWVAKTTGQLRQYTDRPIRIREKPGHLWGQRTASAPFEHDLKDAWALVTLTSNTAMDALWLGVPPFVLGENTAALCGNTDLASIETPNMSVNREALAGLCAAHQWTLAEIESGECIKRLEEMT